MSNSMMAIKRFFAAALALLTLFAALPSLRAAAAECPDGLGDKLTDLALVLDAFDAFDAVNTRHAVNTCANTYN